MSKIANMSQFQELKTATTVAQQTNLLSSRGMIIDVEDADRWLQFVSYYRLSGYWFPNRESNSNSKKLDTFRTNTKFSNIVALYEADRKLRILVHDAIERIECLPKSGTLEYQNTALYRPKFNVEKWLSTASKRVARAGKKNEAVKHYSEKYGGQYPLWVLAEVLDFSDISMLYEGLPYTKQAEIAQNFGIHIDLGALPRRIRKKTTDKHPLASWLHHLSVVRNSCAHHARVWNKSFVPAPTNILRTIKGLETLEEGQSKRIYGSLLVMAYLLETISPGSQWKEKVKDLVQNSFLVLPGVSEQNMGIHEDWMTAPLWIS